MLYEDNQYLGPNQKTVVLSALKKTQKSPNFGVTNEKSYLLNNQPRVTQPEFSKVNEFQTRDNPSQKLTVRP